MEMVMSYWIAYICFAIVFGSFVGKQSLRLLKYPERYPTWIHFVFFPFSTASEENKGRSLFYSTGLNLFSCISLRLSHLYRNDDESRQKRALYILCTMIFIPFRLIATVYFSYTSTALMFLSVGLIDVLTKLLSKCRHCVDI
jgi:hypothetical protein